MAKAPTPYSGGTLDFDGQIFHEIASEPYVRKDGVPTTVYTLLGKCAVCGGPFTQKVGSAIWDLSRRCQAHKKPTVRVKERRLNLSQMTKSVFD